MMFVFIFFSLDPALIETWLILIFSLHRIIYFVLSLSSAVPNYSSLCMIFVPFRNIMSFLDEIDKADPESVSQVNAKVRMIVIFVFG